MYREEEEEGLERGGFSGVLGVGCIPAYSLRWVIKVNCLSSSTTSLEEGEGEGGGRGGGGGGRGEGKRQIKTKNNNHLSTPPRNLNSSIKDIYPQFYLMVCSTSTKCGRSCGSYCHKLFMRRKREAGHSGGRGRRSPSSILLMTSSFLIPTNGFTPRIRISQQHTPVRRRTEGGGGKRGRRGRRERRRRRGRRRWRGRRERKERCSLRDSENGTHARSYQTSTRH